MIWYYNITPPNPVLRREFLRIMKTKEITPTFFQMFCKCKVTGLFKNQSKCPLPGLLGVQLLLWDVSFSSPMIRRTQNIQNPSLTFIIAFYMVTSLSHSNITKGWGLCLGHSWLSGRGVKKCSSCCYFPSPHATTSNWAAVCTAAAQNTDLPSLHFCLIKPLSSTAGNLYFCLWDTKLIIVPEPQLWELPRIDRFHPLVMTC